ncbi:MAG: phosphoribosylformylglycinamidine synthase subunit PurQ [bacterium]
MKTLILSGFGTNCEKETAHACLKAGAPRDSVSVAHINEIYFGDLELGDYHFLILIGGFLDGDDLGGARACANRFRYRPLPSGGTFLERLEDFIKQGRLVLGICNGFQLLSRLGLLFGDNASGQPASGQPEPGEQASGNGGGRVTLTTNANGRFEDRWVRLRGDGASPCVFTRGIERIELPVRHGEGRMVGEHPGVLSRLVESKLVPLRYCLPDGTPTEEYPGNPNGSPFGIASLCNPQGTVMGLMPHPEAFNHYTNHPRWTRRTKNREDGEDGDGLLLFRNAYEHLRGMGG